MSSKHKRNMVTVRKTVMSSLLKSSSAPNATTNLALDQTQNYLKTSSWTSDRFTFFKSCHRSVWRGRSHVCSICHRGSRGLLSTAAPPSGESDPVGPLCWLRTAVSVVSAVNSVDTCRVKAVDPALDLSASLSVQQDSLSDAEDSRFFPQWPLARTPALSRTPSELWLVSVARRDEAPLELKDERRSFSCSRSRGRSSGT